MFVQVIKGHTSDADGLNRQLDAWKRDVRPGAVGFVGSTGGIAEDGTTIALVRFESSEAAEANAARPEQANWWSETSKYFDGDPEFHNCSEVDEQLGGGSDDAGFVQVIIGTCRDKARLRELEDAAIDKIKGYRPDLIGGVRAWDGDQFFEAVYFTSEAGAREGEANVAAAPPDDVAEFEEWSSLTDETEYLDLSDPRLTS